MDILLYLSEYLQQHTSVGLTGLGTFSKKKFAGRYDKEKQSFLPPGYTLHFTTEVKDADLISNYIAEKRNISKESAEYYINIFAEEINKKLEIEHEANLDTIGRLFFTEHEGLSFEPEKEVNHGSEFFGLPAVTEIETPVEAPKDEAEKTAGVNETADEEKIIHNEIEEAPSKDLDRGKSEENTQNPVVPVIENIELDEVKDDLKQTLSGSSSDIIDVEHEDFDQLNKASEHAQPQDLSSENKSYINLEEEASVEEVHITDVPDFIKEQHEEHPNRFGHDPSLDYSTTEETKSSWTKIWIGLAIVFIILAAAAYYTKPEWFKNSPKAVASPQAPVDTVQVKSVDTLKARQDSSRKTDSILKANQVQHKTDTEKHKPLIEEPQSGTISYEVIGASFKTEKKAVQFIEQMKAYGLKAKIVPIEGPYKKVSIASYKTEKEALEARPALSKKINIKELDIKQINTP